MEPKVFFFFCAGKFLSAAPTSSRQEVTGELKRLADRLQKLGDQAHKDFKDAVDYL